MHGGRQFLDLLSFKFTVNVDHWATFLDVHLPRGWISAYAYADPRPLGLPLYYVAHHLESALNDPPVVSELMVLSRETAGHCLIFPGESTCRWVYFGDGLYPIAVSPRLVRCWWRHLATVCDFVLPCCRRGLQLCCELRCEGVMLGASCCHLDGGSSAAMNWWSTCSDCQLWVLGCSSGLECWPSAFGYGSCLGCGSS
jgi:hypothetical protein